MNFLMKQVVISIKNMKCHVGKINLKVAYIQT